MSLSNLSRSPLGAFVRSALGARGSKRNPDIYVGGKFTGFDGVTCVNLVRYDRVNDVWESLGNPGGTVTHILGFNKQIIFANGAEVLDLYSNSVVGSAAPGGTVYGIAKRDGKLIAYGEDGGAGYLAEWSGSGAWSYPAMPANVTAITDGVVIDDVFYCRGTYDDGTPKGFIGKYDGVWSVQAHTHIMVNDPDDAFYNNLASYNVTNYNGLPCYANGYATATIYGQIFTWDGSASGGITQITGNGGDGRYFNSDVYRTYVINGSLYATGEFYRWRPDAVPLTPILGGISKMVGSEFVPVASDGGVTPRLLRVVTSISDGTILTGFSPKVIPTELDGITNGMFFDYTGEVWSAVPFSTGITAGSNVVIKAIFDGWGVGLVLNNISPTSGSIAGGETVTLYGYNFTQGMSVKVDGVTVDKTIVSANELTITTPPHDAGTIDIVVSRGADSDTFSYEYIDDYVAPEITVESVDPASGSAAGGDTVTITGTGFTADCRVLFSISRDEVEIGLDFTFISDTEITCVTPAWGYDLGPVNVVVEDTVTDASGLLAEGFEYT